jgi:CBS domain containing-hemolysin-like protein
VVTLEDIVEELVGEIEDEYDPGGTEVPVQVSDGVWAVAATVRPDEIERMTGIDLPDGEYDTVAGLVLDRLERMAEVGDSVEVNGATIEVVDVDGFAIQRVTLTAPVEEAESDDAGEPQDRRPKGDA